MLLHPRPFHLRCGSKPRCLHLPPCSRSGWEHGRSWAAAASSPDTPVHFLIHVHLLPWPRQFWNHLGHGSEILCMMSWCRVLWCHTWGGVLHVSCPKRREGSLCLWADLLVDGEFESTFLRLNLGRLHPVLYTPMHNYQEALLMFTKKVVTFWSTGQ